MRLAEALSERSDTQVRLEELKKRLARSARVQEGEQPAEDAGELLNEADRLYERLQTLINAINRTNCQTRFDNERTVADAIIARDLAGKKREMLLALAEAASVRQDRYTKSEVKFVPTVSIAELQRQADALARERRELDTRLQEMNWSTELL